MILFEKVFYINFALVNSKLIRGGVSTNTFYDKFEDYEKSLVI